MKANGECIVNEFLDEHRTLVMTYTIQVTLSTEAKYFFTATDNGDAVNSKASEEASVGFSAQHPDCRSPSVFCESTALCMSRVQLCDGKLDCPDGSDELSCVDSCQKMGNVHACLKLVYLS